MKFSLTFCTVVFGSALAITACTEHASESKHEDIISGPVTANPFNQVVPPTIKLDRPIKAVKQPVFVDDSCYTFPACVAYNKARYGY